jgi:Ca-activated chloride channel family protein
MVTDQFGRNIRGLDKQNFQIYDGTEQRPIVSFSRQDAPVSVGLVYDCSRSMSDKFAISREAASQLFAQLNPEDEAFVVTVSDRIELRHDFTSELGDVQGALTFVRPKGTTALLDGIYMGLSHMRKAHNPRKALVVVSDGGDNNSRYNLKEVLRKAMESDVLIYTIGIFQNPQSPEEVYGPDLLKGISQKTGGIPFMLGSAYSVAGAMSNIGVSLHNQYVIGYYPPEDAPGGKYHKIKVKLVAPAGFPRLQVYARAGYYVPER